MTTKTVYYYDNIQVLKPKEKQMISLDSGLCQSSHEIENLLWFAVALHL